MEHVAGRVYRRRMRSGWRYYYRRSLAVGVFDKRVKRKDVRVKLGGNLEQAMARAKELDAEQEAALRGEEPRRDATLGQFIPGYVADVRDRMHRQAWPNIAAHVERFLEYTGDLPMRRIGPGHVEGFYRHLLQAVRATTANAYLKNVRRMFAVAQEWGFVETNPATKVRRETGKPLPVRLPTWSELETLLGSMQTRHPWLFRLSLVLLGTGCRLSEALGLDWSDIDMTQGRLVLRRSKVQDVLAFPLGDGPLKDELWSHWTASGMPRKGLVFPAKDGGPLTRTGVLTMFKRTAAAVGLSWLCLKTFRKVAATTVAESTGDVRLAQHLLGHGSIRTTELYLGRGEVARAQAANVLSRQLTGTVGTKVGTRTDSPEGVGMVPGEKSKQ